ncbi:MAG: succinate dehydrogenase, cytochrome b556 subunit [Deltaproteobacteria bacterium RBG_13_61_14]|nr:MAG: succinate dehydrogenase, cytochrome b556 subunit [Deltaproteobacteria bacterium RBG_13_61_14]
MKVIKHYRWQVGSAAYAFHRISGLALIAYLPLHIWVMHYLRHGPKDFNAAMEFLAQPIFKLSEWALFAAIIYHGLNGLRIVAVDLGLADKLPAQKKWFWAAALAGLIAFLAVGVGLFGAGR